MHAAIFAINYLHHISIFKMKKNNSISRGLLHASFIVAVLFGLSSCSNNQKAEDTKDIAEEHNDAKFNDTKNEKDAQFLVNAAEINLEEMKLGQLAQQNSKNAEVRDLGKMMEKAHSKAMEELTGLASKKSITIPSAPTDAAMDSYTKLGKKAGPDFDKEYCEMMVNGHKDAIVIFENASSVATDNDIRQWANAMLPGLRAHLDKSITCQKNCEKMN